ncbi:hypothetical protein Tsubulata_023638 [Turnera subulata]|uniref:GPI-anchored protein LLG1-like domain-containing protein n=1 Tax=Turnera subulata TaxID=218843 RepID=A0A9Q0JHA4_9ROSI|nr:hypothetical protein Tsubulata_047062 [Turnera subulata]KAJ4840660.1 hypothetical protein Tsubulata_023638 [Turnera subulata]
MACGGNTYLCYFTCFFLLAGLATSATVSRCTIPFEILDYSRFQTCKAPEFATEACCGALSKFSCPYADDINDLSTGCADEMFAYIYEKGRYRYPDRLFLELCGKDGKDLGCESSDEPSIKMQTLYRDP